MQALLIQLDIIWRDKVANFCRVEELVGSVVRPGALVILPEMFATGFDVDACGVEEGQPGCLGPTGDFLSGLARRYEIYIQGSGIAPGTKAGMRQNLVVAYGPDGNLLATYRKMHPFRYGGEHRFFEAGVDLVEYPVGDLRVAPAICYDLRFPELFRHLFWRGVQVFAVAANWPAARHAHWELLLRARAVENQAWVLGVNRVGKDPFARYLGGSLIVSPRGEVVARGGDVEEVIEAEIDSQNVQSWRDQFPVRQDMVKKLLGM